MNIKIGENIKKLRKEKGITQEGLAEICNVSAVAVSKWENQETYPDMSLLMPLAYYFEVSIDELLGYNNEKVEKEINQLITEYFNWYYIDSLKASKIIAEAYQKYPNSYHIIYNYMYDIAGGKADNDLLNLVDNKDLLLKLSARLLKSDIEKYRLDAFNIKAKVLYACGNTKEAMQLYETKFADWYQTKGQKMEQLFPKDSEEFRLQLADNIRELLSFAGNKIGKHIIYSLFTEEEKIQQVKLFYKMLNQIENNPVFEVIKPLFDELFKETYHRAKLTGMKQNTLEQFLSYKID